MEKTFIQLVMFHYTNQFEKRNNIYLSLSDKDKDKFIDYLFENEIPIEGAFYELDELELKTWQYSVSTNTIWTSFDYGEVQAFTREQAREKAIAELDYNFEKANTALNHCDITKGFSVEFCRSQVEIKEKQ